MVERGRTSLERARIRARMVEMGMNEQEKQEFEKRGSLEQYIVEINKLGLFWVV